MPAWGLFAVMAIASLSALSGCTKPVAAEGCSQDLDCAGSQRCDVTRGLCLCIDDNACDTTEFCNVAGSCQALLECQNNADCNASEMCDSTTGSCIRGGNGVCVLDSQCPFGEFCAQNRACTPGCRDDGDCALGVPCINGTCDETPGACSNLSYCEFGQTCGANNRCIDHPDRNQLCGVCDPSDIFDDACPDECLIDSSVRPTVCSSNNDCDRGTCEEQRCQSNADCNAGTCGNIFFGVGTCTQKICQGFFCGAFECDDTTNPCPRGYVCNQLQLVSGTQCQLNGPAGQCGAGRGCVGGGENGNVGFCSCAADSDCPQSVQFDPVCVNPGPNGACVIGTTCGPASGLLCEDLR